MAKKDLVCLSTYILGEGIELTKKDHKCLVKSFPQKPRPRESETEEEEGKRRREEEACQIPLYFYYGGKKSSVPAISQWSCLSSLLSSPPLGQIDCQLSDSPFSFSFLLFQGLFSLPAFSFVLFRRKKEVNGIFRKTACNNGPPSLLCCYLQTKRTERTHTVVSHPLFYFLICTVRENDVRAEAKVEKSRELLLIFRDSPNISALLRKVVLLYLKVADVVPTSFCKRVGSFTSSSFSFRFWKRRRIGLLLCTCSSPPPPPVFFAFSPVPEVHHFPGCVFQRKREKNEG